MRPAVARPIAAAASLRRQPQERVSPALTLAADVSVVCPQSHLNSHRGLPSAPFAARQSAVSRPKRTPGSILIRACTSTPLSPLAARYSPAAAIAAAVRATASAISARTLACRSTSRISLRSDACASDVARDKSIAAAA